MYLCGFNEAPCIPDETGQAEDFVSESAVVGQPAAQLLFSEVSNLLAVGIVLQPFVRGGGGPGWF